MCNQVKTACFLEFLKHSDCGGRRQPEGRKTLGGKQKPAPAENAKRGTGSIWDHTAMKVLALSGAARRLKSSRGVYRKKTNRDRDVPAAWKIGDPGSFAKAKSITMERICLDPNLGGKAKAVLANCLKRMNCHEQWSCFVSIERLAEDSQTSKPTCWRAIHDADGIYIATKTGRRSKSQCYP